MGRMHEAIVGLLLMVAWPLSSPAVAQLKPLTAQLEAEFKGKEFETKIVLASIWEYRSEAGKNVRRYVDTEVYPGGGIAYVVRRWGGEMLVLAPSSHIQLGDITTTLPVGTRVRVTKVEVMNDRFELFLNSVPGNLYAKLKFMMGKGFERSSDIGILRDVVSRALLLEDLERARKLQSEFKELLTQPQALGEPGTASSGGAQKRLEIARERRQLLQALAQNRSEYAALQKPPDSETGVEYARKAAGLDNAIRDLETQARKERVAEVRKTLKTVDEEENGLKEQLRQKRNSLADWERHNGLVKRWEGLLAQRATLYAELSTAGEPAAPEEATSLEKDREELQALRQALAGEYQHLELAALNSEYQELEKKKIQILDAYTRAFGTPQQRMKAERLLEHLQRMYENRQAAQKLATDPAAGQAAAAQAAALLKEMERIRRQQPTGKVLVGFIQLGNIAGGDESVYWLTPLLIYENGKYQSCDQELQKIFSEKTRSPQSGGPEEEANKFLRPFQEGKFFLYHKGRVVGEFKTTGPMNLELPDGIGFPGRISWKVPKPKRGEDGFFTKAIGLNRLIAQPFWSKASLTEAQSQELKKEGRFTLYPLDIDGDSIAEFILDRLACGESPECEVWEYFLYRMERGRLVKVLALGGGGL